MAAWVPATVAAGETANLVYTNPSLSDKASLNTFMDGLMAGQMGTAHIAGASVVIVKDGQIIFSKAYGVSDDNKTVRPLANQTLFRPGSISKLIMWTAVMQLVEQGKIDLDTDVNVYLKGIQIPDTYPGQPITMRNLMTHTAGFEESDDAKLVELNEAGVRFSADGLKQMMPKRVFPPGRYSGYSNFGAALAGYIVQDVSGMDFEAYAQKNIFAPLNMTSSTFVEPVPAAMKPYASDAYLYANGVFTNETEETIGVLYPAGSLFSTADDMGNFMIAHLQNGRFRDNRIMREETATLMHSAQFSSDPRMPPMDLGFYGGEVNGRTIVQHGGDLNFFHSQLTMVPGENLGIFVSYNTQTASSNPVRDNLVQSFMDEYYPVVHSQPMPMAGYKERIGQYAGDYLYDRTIFSDYHNIKNIAPFAAKATDSGTLLFMNKQFVETEPGYFRQIDGADSLLFKKDANGNVVEAYDASLPFFAFFRVPGYDAASFNVNLMLVLKIVFGLTLLLWAVKAVQTLYMRFVKNRGSGGKAKGMNARSKGMKAKSLEAKKKAQKKTTGVGVVLHAKIEMAIMCVVFLLYLVWINDFLTAGVSMIPKGQYLGLLGTVLLVISIALGARAWKLSSKCEKIHFALLILAGLVMMVWMWHWKLFFVF